MSKKGNTKLLPTLQVIGLLMYPSLCLSADKERNNPLLAFIGTSLGVYALGERVPAIHCHSNIAT